MQENRYVMKFISLHPHIQIPTPLYPCRTPCYPSSPRLAPFSPLALSPQVRKTHSRTPLRPHLICNNKPDPINPHTIDRIHTRLPFSFFLIWILFFLFLFVFFFVCVCVLLFPHPFP